MRMSLLILIFLVAPLGLRADDNDHKKKKLHHHKHVKIVHHKSKKTVESADSHSRYKLVTYYKNGKIKHKYIDTHVIRPAAKSAAIEATDPGEAGPGAEILPAEEEVVTHKPKPAFEDRAPASSLEEQLDSQVTPNFSN